MNQLKLNVVHPDYKLTGRENYVTAEIDGEDFLKSSEDLDGSIVFFEDLYKSCIEEGSYLIFTCECGIADCAGWELVEVAHCTETISWTFTHEKLYKFTFNKKLYLKEVERFKLLLDSKYPWLLYNQTDIYPES